MAYIFDDLWSFLHFLYGFAIAFIEQFNLRPIAVVLLVVYILYERVSKNDYFYMVGDYVEMILGYLTGKLLVS